ncbi:hypothetical protein RYD26_05810 [Pasteurellaceae bacterium LIM206]|nr:hypothetical protein [Pasteurellaceae bacterium LIM206]
MKKLLFTLVLAFTGLYATASPLSNADRHAIKNKLTQLETAFQQKQWNTVLNGMPPKLLERMASQSGMTPEMMRQSLLGLASGYMQGLDVQSYGYHLNQAIAGKSASQRDYAFIPAYYRASLNGKQHQGSPYILGIEDNHQWYFISWTNQFKDAVKQAYPDLANIPEPEAK